MRDIDVQEKDISVYKQLFEVLPKPRQLSMEQAYLVFYSIFMNILDYFISIQAIKSGKGVESNPFMADMFAGHDYLSYIGKIVFFTVFLLFLGFYGMRYSRYQYHPIRILFIANSIFWTVVVINNLVMMI
jgi:hypothetical protein